MSNVTEPASFEGWATYPSNLPFDKCLGFDGESLCQSLTNNSSVLFSQSIEVRVIESQDVAPTLSPLPRTLRSKDAVETHLQSNFAPQMRLIEVAQGNSFSPFAISEELMRKTLTRHTVPPQFLDLLFGVGGNTRVSEEAYGAAVLSKRRTTRESCDITYQLKYVERNGHAHGSPWSIRQMEVFNRVTRVAPSSDGRGENFWIVLSPMPESKAENRMEMAISEPETFSKIVQNPLRLHILFFSAYVDNWREYLDHEGQIYQKQRKEMLATEFEEDDDFDANINFEALLTLRSLQERLLSLPVILKSTISTVDTLIRMNEDINSGGRIDVIEKELVADSLSSIRSRVCAHLRSAEMLQKRVEGVEKLLADGLSLRNQVIAATNQKIAASNQNVATEINQKLYDLQLQSVDDSSYVQLVSLATLIYLPGSFLASLFGMNFFDFSKSGKSAELEIASDIWIYFIFTIPLTLVTIAGWAIASKQQRVKRAKTRAQTVP